MTCRLPSSRSSILVLLALTPFGACNCDDLVALQVSRGELRIDDVATPPEEFVQADIGKVGIGASGAATIQLNSIGNLPLQVASVALGPHAPQCPTPSTDFHITSAFTSGAIDAGDGQELVVTFTPSTGQPACTALTVNTNDDLHATLFAIIRAQGDAPGLCTDTPVIDFGDVLVNTTADQVITLESCGTRALTITSLDQQEQFPPFAIDAPAGTIVLEPGDTVDVPAHFSPTIPLRYSMADQNAGAILVNTDVPGALYQIFLEGRGITPPSCELDVVPATLNFGFQQPSSVTTQPVLLRNIGDLDCTLTSLALETGVPEFAFSAPGFTAGMTLAPFDTLIVDVTFTAPAAEATVNDALLVGSDDPDEPTVTVPLQGAVPSDQGCFVNVVPGFVDFGAVQLNTLRAREVIVTNVGQDPCFVTETRIAAASDPGFIDTSSDFGIIAPGNSRTLTVGFRPTVPGAADGTFEIDVSDSFFGGVTTTTNVALSAFTADPGICVIPRIIDFGNVDTEDTKTFEIQACGPATIEVTALTFVQSDSEISLSSPPGLPITLAPGATTTITVRYTPVDEGGDTAVLHVVSNDLVTPEVPVHITGGHSIVPVEAGRFLYFWQIPGAGIAGGDVMKLPLQGDTTATSFWGPRSGKGCSGCHSVSPDGKYVAVIEFGTMRFVEADTNLELYLGDTAFLDPTSFSWRPNIGTTPPYQFAYSDGADVRIGTLFDGEIGLLQGADDGTLIDTMPSWGRDGKIAFVRGASAQTTSDGSFGLAGPTDIFLVDQDGGTPVPLEGASQNGMANYYPAYSPNGSFIAFTQSASATSTIAATDATLRMANSANDGVIYTLDNINSPTGPSSYTTWSVDGTYLSFSSQRTGGAGSWDLYIAPMDPLSGSDGSPTALTEVNTADFEHAAQWSP